MSYEYSEGELGYSWDNARQSQNVIDLRAMRPVTIRGILTWNTFFHLRNNTPLNIANTLLNRGFYVSRVETTLLNWGASKYSYAIFLMVSTQYSVADVRVSISNVLKPITTLNSIIITDFPKPKPAGRFGTSFDIPANPSTRRR